MAYTETWYYIDDGSPKSTTRGPKLYALKDARGQVSTHNKFYEMYGKISPEKWKIIPVTLTFGEPIN